MLLFCGFRVLNRRLVLWSLLSILSLCGAVAGEDANSTNSITSSTTPHSSPQVASEQHSTVATFPMKNSTSIGNTSQPMLIQDSETTVALTAATTLNASSIEVSDSNTTILSEPTPEDTTKTMESSAASQGTKETEIPSSAASPSPALYYSSIVNSTSPTLEGNVDRMTTVPFNPVSVVCQSSRNIASKEIVASFQHQENITCEQLRDGKENKLKEILCDAFGTNITSCNLTLSSSEANPKLILLISPPLSQEATAKLETQRKKLKEANIEMELMFSQPQTQSKKTMIALVTSGILLAILILAGYFLSNRQSWSPGRQRLGEDPYYTETDSRGNTLVSASAHGQAEPRDKANRGTRENGAGQAVTPTATNGHSSRQQAVSDTEL
ncbi:hematopoietic progenitor cell antigen CD34-like isoform X1 [Ascaphus truei]|uniref:hematopoietic progenitor cell antigen CD34-like isoform X1 n=1 Tax=Ascaphus truei TaxID=8439 RepID=UPI003F598301